MLLYKVDIGPMKGRLYKHCLACLLTLLVTACSSGGDGTTAVFQLAVSIDGPGAGSVLSLIHI